MDDNLVMDCCQATLTVGLQPNIIVVKFVSVLRSVVKII